MRTQTLVLVPLLAILWIGINIVAVPRVESIQSLESQSTATPLETIPQPQVAEVIEIEVTEVMEVTEEPEFLDLPSEETPTAEETDSNSIYTVPFFSQFTDITSPAWKKVGCGIASLAMLIDFYEPGVVNVDELLEKGIGAHAYLDNAGWTYVGLIGLSNDFGLMGETHDFGGLTVEKAYNNFKKDLEEGPLMASVHYTFKPTNPIPHLVVITGLKDGLIYYNDPADKTGGKSLDEKTFLSAWKKRYIEIRPL